jgi:hypothetical protein
MPPPKQDAYTYGEYPRTKSDAFAEKILEIKKSSIPNSGLGVWAKEGIARGTALGRYSGIAMNKEALDALYGDKLAEYALTVTCARQEDCGFDSKGGSKHEPHSIIIDAKSNGNWASRINDGPHSGFSANVAFGDDGTVYVTKNIKGGEELFADYGSDYW